MEFAEPVAPCTVAFLKYINGFLLLIGCTLLGVGDSRRFDAALNPF
jgi:hypothetical protein